MTKTHMMTITRDLNLRAKIQPKANGKITEKRNRLNPLNSVMSSK